MEGIEGYEELSSDGEINFDGFTEDDLIREQTDEEMDLISDELDGLMQLASDPVRCSSLTNHEVLESLCLVLRSTDENAVFTVLKIIEKLVSHEEHRSKVSQFTEMCKPIQVISQSETCDRQELARKLYDTLWPPHLCLEQMKILAADPTLCTSFVVDDSVLTNLVAVLGNGEENMLKLTLETLFQMAEWTKHRPRMKYFKGLLDQVQSIQNRPVDASIKELAQKLHDRLYSEREESKEQENLTPVKEDKFDVASSNVFKDKSNMNRHPGGLKKGRKSIGLGSIKGKTIILQIKGLDHKDDVELCRNRILTVKGLISITFDLKKKRSIIRARPELKPEVLAEAIALTKTMAAEQVTIDDQGNESLISFGSKHEGLNKENDNMPDYPADDSPIFGEHNMASMGSCAGTPGAGWGFVKKVGDFLTTSFYW